MAQVRDAPPQERIREQPPALEFDQHRGVAQENDTVPGRARATGRSRAIGHGLEGSNAMSSHNGQRPGPPHPARWRIAVGFLLRAAAMLAAQALALIVLTALLPGSTLSVQAALLVAVVMALINALLWPLLTRIALPLTIITFGLGSLVLSAGMVALAFYVVDGKTPSFGDDLAIAFGLALVSMLLAPLLDVDGDARQLRVVRRRRRRFRTTTTPRFRA